MTREKDQKSEIYRFDGRIVDADRRELTLAGELVTMQPKAFELLLYLIRNRHRAVDKDELQDQLWPRSIVTETALTRCVMKARRGVGDDTDKQAIIRTIHGHGYRFTATVDEDAISAPATSAVPTVTAKTTARETNLRPFMLVGAAAGLLAVIVFTWLFFAPPAFSDPVRLAILPVENATGDAELDWVSTGLVALMSRMLEDGGIETVSSRDVSSLAGETPLAELIATGSEFRSKLSQTAAATHVIGSKLEDSNGLYRLTYTLAGVDERPVRRTMVGKEPAKLVRDVADTVAALVLDGVPTLEPHVSLSQDDFLNEAYARAMSLYHEGRYEEAKGLFDLIIEQEPHLFWPRYERALTIRNQRDFDGAERDLVALRDEVSKPGMESELASVENALGIIYWTRRQHDKARESFLRVVDLAQLADKPSRAASGLQNLGLVAKNVNKPDEALEYMRQAEQVYNDLDIEILPGSLLNNMSGVMIQQGHFETAEGYSLRAIESFRLRGQRLNEATSMNRLADIYSRQRFYDEAVEMAENALSIRLELNYQYGVGSSHVSIADIAALRGDHTRALQHAQQAYDISIDIESPRLMVPALIRIARAESRLGDPAAAATRYEMIESIARQTDDPHNVFRARMGLADTLIKRGRHDDAAAIANELLTETRDQDQRREETAVIRLLAAIDSEQGRHQQAIDALEEVLAYASSSDDTVVQASVHILLAKEYLAMNNPDAAEPHVSAATIARPEDADSLRVQAGFQFSRGNVDGAAQSMGLARTLAGEGWTDEDESLLTQYRETASVSE